MLGWSFLAVFGGAFIYLAFTILTGIEASFIGIPVGLAIGQTMFYASGKRGGRWFQALSVVFAFAAFDLTYAPGMAAIAFKGGITVVAFAFFAFMTAVSPVTDSQNGLIGQFMVAAGMYLAWTVTRDRKPA